MDRLYLRVCVFAVAALAISVGPLHAAIDPETAVGVWLMDEDGGDTAADSSGRALTAR